MARMPVEWGKIREYARATGAVRPEYFDDPAAPVPPTFLSTVVFWESLRDVLDGPEAVTALTEQGIEPGVTRLLSVGQEYLFHGPPPRAGDVLETALRFDGVSVKDGRQGGRMVLVDFAVEFHGETGGLRAECRYTSAYLVAAPGGQVAGRVTPPPPAAASVAGLEELPPRRFGAVTMTDIVRYQGASGDFNPMHHDDELARSAGYPAAFSVGMLGAGYLATYCCDRFGVDTVRRFRTRFRDLVWRGDELVATATVMRIHEEAGEKRAELDLCLATGTGAVAVEGVAEFVVG